MKLTDNQRSALVGLVNGAASASELKCSVATLHSLERHGLAYQRTDAAFAMAFPRSAKWLITEEGVREAWGAPSRQRPPARRAALTKGE